MKRPAPQPVAATLRLVGKQDTLRQIDPSPTDMDVDWSILMARAQTGDADSYVRLLEAITPYLRTIARRRCPNVQDVEDAVQDILVTIHTIRATYDPARPFGPWLVAIANRRIIDQLRRRMRRANWEQPAGPEYDNAPDSAPLLDEQTDFQSLNAALAELPPGQQQAIRLLKLNELSLREAAETSGLSIAALKVATHRALQSLRSALTKETKL